MFKTNTLRTKFLLSFTLISLGYIALSSFFIFRIINDSNSRVTKNNFLRWANDFEAMVEANFIYFHYMNMTAQTEEILKGRPDDFIMLFDSQHKEIIYRGPDWLPPHLEPFKQGLQNQIVETYFKAQKYYLISLPVQVAASDTIWGYILLGISNKENQAIIQNLRWLIIFISSALLIVFTSLVVLINKKLTEPIQLLKNGLGKISYGNFSYRLQIKSNDEFAFLGAQFNEMAEKIESMMTEIEATHRDLEKQVLSRTRELNESNKKLQIAMQELRDTQKHIIQSEKQKSLTTIVSGFAHEINNPLTGILGYVDLMTIRDDISPYVREKLISIQKQTLRIKTIIDQLNQLNPDMEQIKMPINLSNLLEKLIKVVSNRLGNSDVTVEKNNFDQEITIHGNHFALWQVFEGIVENSIEALNENKIQNGKIIINLKNSVDNKQAIVDIIDNGGGFSNLDKAFDPFYTTKNRTQKKGIGLTIAYNIIQEHQGNIVISNNERQGATVSVYLKRIEMKLKNQNQAEEK